MTLAIALALPHDGRLVGLERDTAMADFGEQDLQKRVYFVRLGHHLPFDMQVLRIGKRQGYCIKLICVWVKQLLV